MCYRKVNWTVPMLSLLNLNLKIKVSGGLIWPSHHCNINLQYRETFKLRPKYTETVQQFRTNGVKAERAQAPHKKGKSQKKSQNKEANRTCALGLLKSWLHSS